LDTYLARYTQSQFSLLLIRHAIGSHIVDGYLFSTLYGVSTALQVGRSRVWFPVSPGIFPVASDSFICPGVDSDSKNKYQDNTGGKAGRCVRLTTYHLHVPIVKKSGGLNLLEPCGPVQACNGTALPYGVSIIAYFCQSIQSHSIVWYLSDPPYRAKA